MTPGAPLLIRADGGPRRGAGHVMRCLALAQAWRAGGGGVTFVFAEPPGALLQRVRDEGFAAVVLEPPAASSAEAAATVELAQGLGCDWIVVDGYHLTASYRRRLSVGHRLLVVDDEGGGDFRCAHLVLNQNLHADAALYRRRGAGTRLLLGPRYLLLRDEFLRQRGVQRHHPPRVRRLLLTFGGADPRGGAARMLDALAAAGFGELEVTAVEGSHRGAAAALRHAAERAAFPVAVRRCVTDMAPLMLDADLALTSGGTTVWEMAFLRLPALVVTTSEGERKAAEGLRRTGLCEVLGDLVTAADPGFLRQRMTPWLDDAQRRRAAGEEGRQIVDGKGRRRVVETMWAVDRTPGG